MTLSKERSIAADSTMSLSSPQVPPHVKRAARTYGRRRDSELVSSSSYHSDDTGGDSSSGLYKTGPTSLDDEVPPTSDGLHTLSEPEQADDEDEDSDSENARETAGFQFEWQKRIKALDEQDEFPDVQFGDAEVYSQSQETLCDASLSSAADDRTPAAMSSTRCKKVPLSSRVTQPLQMSPSGCDSAAPSLNKLGGVGGRRRAIIRDSDSERDSPLQSSSHPATSPQNLHPIATPKSRSSATPPTSDDEMRNPLFMKPAGLKGSTSHRSPTMTTDDESAPGSSKHPHEGKRADVTKRQRPPKKGKVKAPTKKELADTTRARARLAADQHVSIARTNESSKFALTEFLTTLDRRPLRHEASTGSIPSSDPISQFGSSPVVQTTLMTSTSAAPQPVIPLVRSQNKPVHPPDSDEDLPDVKVLFKTEDVSREGKVSLREQKLKLLARQGHKTKAEDESEDDLLVVDNTVKVQDMHIVAEAAAEERRSHKQRHIGPSKGKRILEQFGHVRNQKGDPAHLTQAELNKELTNRVVQMNRTTIEQKETEWKRRGGKIRSNADADVQGVKTIEDAVKAYAETARQLKDQGVDEETDDQKSDEDWAPDDAARGSESSASDEGEGEGEGEDGGSVVGFGEEDMTLVNDENESQEACDDENRAPIIRRSRGLIIDSDDENVSPFASASRQSPVPSLADQLSIDEPTEDEDDKENSTRLMYDRSDDKENKAVARHSPESCQTSSPSKEVIPSLPNNDEHGQGEKPREPFKDLLSDEDPFASPTRSTSFTARLLQTSPQTAASVTQLSPFASQRFSPQKLGGLVFSQFSNDEENGGNTPFKAAPLQPGFSQLFGSSTQTAGSSARGGLNALRKPNLDDLPLTLDVILQPALDVDDSVRKQADAVFEKEQEYLLDAAQFKPSSPKLYVNDHGFLTQTRPDVTSPNGYKMFSPSQPNPLRRARTEPDPLSQATSLSQGSRHPLRTILFAASDDLDIETPGPSRRRIRRRRSSSLSATKDGGYDSSPSQSPIKAQSYPNAFDVITRNEARMGKEPHSRGKLAEGAAKDFVAAEAEESDDDMGAWGLRMSKKDEEGEEEGLEADKTLVDLVDDTVMDQETEAADKVYEKFQEHLQEEDDKLDKLAHDAVDGKLRHKKRRAVGLEESDEESDQEAKAIRRTLHKRRCTDRDNIQVLGDDAATRAFYQTYQDGLVDDQVLVQESAEDELMAVQSNGDDEDGSESDTPREVVTARDIHKEIRERMDNGGIETGDMNDVSWIDEGEEMADHDAIQLKCASVRAPAARTSSSFSKKGWMDMDIELDAGPSSKRTQSAQRNGGSTTSDGSHPSQQRMQQWAQSERRSGRLETTGRSVSRVAVTGHKGGAGEVRMKGAKVKGSGVAGRSKKAPLADREAGVKASRSMVLGAVDRKARFE